MEIISHIWSGVFSSPLFLILFFHLFSISLSLPFSLSISFSFFFSPSLHPPLNLYVAFSRPIYLYFNPLAPPNQNIIIKSKVISTHETESNKFTIFVLATPSKRPFSQIKHQIKAKWLSHNPFRVSMATLLIWWKCPLLLLITDRERQAPCIFRYSQRSLWTCIISSKSPKIDCMMEKNGLMSKIWGIPF